MIDKTTLRQEAAARRDAVAARVDAGPAVARLQRMLGGTRGAVSFYWPIRSEIDPRPVMRDLQAAGRVVCLPVALKDRPLSFRAWTPETAMEVDAFGVETPGPDAALVVPDLLVVPLLAFDSRLHRLGYGAGHYDRTLAALRREGEAIAIGFAFAAQEVPELPILPTDVALDAVVTERGVRRAD